MDSKKILKRLLIGALIMAAGFLPFAVQYAATGSDEANDINICAMLMGFTGGIIYPFGGIQKMFSVIILILVTFTFDNILLRILACIVLYYGLKFLYFWYLRIKNRQIILQNHPGMTKKEADQKLAEINDILSDPEKTMEAYEKTCLPQGYFHVATPDGEVLKVMVEAGELYFCHSGCLEGNPFKEDECKESLKVQLSKNKSNFSLWTSEISEVLVQALPDCHKNGRKKLKLIFKTSDLEYEFLDMGVLDRKELEQLLREDFLLNVKGCPEL